MADTSTQQAPAKAQAQQILPFTIGSRASSRFSFSLGTTSLGSAQKPLSPIQIPAVGYLTSITLDVTVETSGGSAPAWADDGPFSILSLIELRNSSGNDLIVPMDGYRYYCLNKYGCQSVDAPYSDAKLDTTYDDTVTKTHFILDVPCQISPADAFGAIPALASNRSYQLAVSLDSIAGSFDPVVTSGTVTINGYANYWTEPVAQTMGGVSQQTAPPFNGSLNLWQNEPISVTPGDKYLKSGNVGNVLRTLIFTLRDSSGDRIETDGWPELCELYLDNQPMLHLPKAIWESWMSKTYQFRGTKDSAGALDTGVFVIPFFAMSEGHAIANGRRNQYLPTLDASLLQLRGTSWGSSASTLEIMTNSVQPVNPSTGNVASALYNIS